MRIRITKQTHEALCAYNAPRGLDDSQTEYHPDGTVSFNIEADTMARLKQISDDPEVAIRRALGMKAG